MFIHIGNDMSVRRSSVTAIINLETALPSRKDIADFMKLEDEQGRLQDVVDEIPKTLVITDDNDSGTYEDFRQNSVNTA